MTRKRVLCISYQFPPFAGTGVFRVLNFVEHLPDRGWDPVVLTVLPCHYERGTALDDGLCARVNGSARVHRTKCFQGIDAMLSLRGKFRGNATPASAGQGEAAGSPPAGKGLWQGVKDAVTLAYRIPDKQVGWFPYALSEGFRICRREKPDLIYASGGPWTSFLIGLALKAHFHLPLVIDFRDPWMNNPYDELNVGFRRRVNCFLERWCLRRADAVIANTEPLRTLLADTAGSGNKCHTITNGYNEMEYVGLKARASGTAPLVVTHVGNLYGKRTPDSFLQALTRLIDTGRLGTHEVAVRFIGHVDEVRIKNLIGSHPVGAMVTCVGMVPKNQALDMLFQSDIALLIQPDTRLQIPAKLFEYIRSQKPVLAVCGEGATQELIEAHGLGVVADTDDPEGMEGAILDVIRQARSAERVVKKDYLAFEAGALTTQLAGVFDGFFPSYPQTKNG
ncbi:glycosyltransferase family 4 protein [Desulfoluna spongiiphila]|uniref:Glycosyltransferase involved in cell wall bisynthesis n=1 Tax=Desulfoluna spongiiphila TaxID=419481 RepID=A0A1G5BZ65_9BACT|nr:glycosyltransferase family 4 protein [Desulfoluna spongiiphila]SCX95413.1 Glycosyltransferase involved in cell wall bisynthesis [Desulfoluna spongiiphila]